ncbi:MAG: glycosyltransferase family 4 protein [Pseudomonadota bacterium]
MTDGTWRAPDDPQSARIRGHVVAELDQIASLYRLMFPGRALAVEVRWNEQDLIFPVVHEDYEPHPAPLVGGSHVGRVLLPGDPGNTAPPLRVSVTMPDPDGSWEGPSERYWRTRSKIEHWGFAASPMAFDLVKHGLELFARRFVEWKYKFDAQPGPRRNVFGPATTPASKDPAILIGLHWLEVGGAEALAFDTIRWALEAGLRVIAISERPSPERLRGRLPDDPRFRYIRADRYVPRRLTGLLVRRLIETENVRLTHNHHHAGLYEAMPAVRAAHPQVFNIDSTHIVEHRDGGYCRVSGVWSNYLDLRHVISEGLGDFYRDRYGDRPTIRVGRMLSEAQRAAEPKPVRVGPGRKECRVAFVGRMVHQKRPLLVLQAARRLIPWGRRKGIAFRFDLVGEGGYLEPVRKMIERYRLGEHVTLHPAGADVPALLGESDVMLLPSSNEGLALVCYEAILAGCVPITTDVGAQKELVPGELLAPYSPLAAVSRSVGIVKRLLTEGGFAARVETDLHARLRVLAADRRAEELLSPLYRAAAAGERIEVPD